VRIKARILWNLLGICLLVGVVGGRAIYRQRAAGMLEATSEAEEDARVLATIVSADSQKTRDPAEAVSRYMFDDRGRDVEVLDTHRRVIADAHPEEVGGLSDHPEKEVDLTLSDGQVRTFADRNPGSQEAMKEIVVPIKAESGQVTGAVIEEYTPIYDEFMAMTETTTRQVVYGALAAVVASFLLALYLARSIAIPLRQLTRAAVGFAAGQSDLQLPPPRNDEIGDLTVAFNVMMEKRREAEEALSRTRDDLVHERSRLAGILDSLPGIVFEHWSLKDRMSNYVNNYVETMYGFTPREWLSTPDFWVHQVHPEDREQVLRDAGARFAGGAGPRKMQFRWLTKDNRVVWGDTYLSMIRDPGSGQVGVRGFTLDVTEQKRAESELEKTHLKLIEASRQAGMAEVATSVLHNVGNVLNSVNVSATVAADHLRNSSAPHLARVAGLLQENSANLDSYLTTDPTGSKLPAFLTQLAKQLEAERSSVLGELVQLEKNVEHIKDIVAMQQNYATAAGVSQTVAVADLVEDSIRMNAGALTRHEVQLVREYEAQPVIQVDKHKVMQILVNLIRNAKYACDESGFQDKRMTLRITGDDQFVRIAIVDNGTGIPPENLTRIFSLGFTTRKNGHGFGLHSGAIAAMELGGALLVQSDGPGRGATFTLELPVKPTNSTNGH
jgi:PAS domain S-box-containing protein